MEPPPTATSIASTFARDRGPAIAMRSSFSRRSVMSEDKDQLVWSVIPREVDLTHSKLRLGVVISMTFTSGNLVDPFTSWPESVGKIEGWAFDVNGTILTAKRTSVVDGQPIWCRL